MPALPAGARPTSDAKRTVLGLNGSLSRDELAKILVPKYIRSIPEKNPWGHPYEYQLNTQDPNAPHVMALRSAGSDGAFSGDRYDVDSFPSGETKQDLAWMNGFFLRWPEPPRP